VVWPHVQAWPIWLWSIWSTHTPFLSRQPDWHSVLSEAAEPEGTL
jgi:hypothetical protein